jgi:tetratricopeptide (TPR) repeat protein
LSKLSQLKQKAYQAGKNRDWDQAISVYEQILELEKSNPTIINELGDLCLKAGNSRKAVKHFLSASSKYRKTGLLNNSVAICKKILRHDDSNMHAHWYLAEIRSSQDLVVEGEPHALAFLAGGDQMGSEIQEIYLQRCSKLLELYPASQDIMDRLVQVFRSWEKPLEASRAGCLKACVIYDTGDKDGAQAILDDIMVVSPELKNYPEFGKWNKRVNPDAVDTASLADYNSVNLEGSESADQPQADSPAAAPLGDQPAAPSAEDISFTGISIEIPEEIAADTSVTDTKDDEGCLVIDTDDDSDMEELIAKATKEVAVEDASSPDAPAADDLDKTLAAIPALDDTAAAEEAVESVDLLAQILSEDSGAVLGDDSSQLDTIAAEIGNMVGGAGSHDDADRLYEMGMVYLEMGLFDKACESFETSAADDDYTIRAHEMWGITLQRAGRPDEAIRVLTSGLQFAEHDSRENLGLRYHIGRAHELAERPEIAVGIYEEIQDVAPNFLDTSTRLSQLAGV